ncbi:MAG: ANTAR domain-containing protein [Pseudomonadota bacterium]
MQQPSSSSPQSVLLIASATEISDSLRSSLQESYRLQIIPEDAMVSMTQASLDATDIVLFVKASLDNNDLERISSMLTAIPMPFLVFVDSDPNSIARPAIRAGVTSFVVDGLVAARVPTLIEVTMERFKLSESLRNELLKSQEELAARKVIERAKGLLMEKKQLSEQEAYRALRELAMRQSKSIKDVAETLLVYSDVLP